ncbi:MAG TPA: potassium channel family protein [Pyrinomonadaceae bacterium]|nr:potassium channel family protein [Pyrinomonadaceae bacterium]
MTRLLFTAAGLALLLLVVFDVYATVLHASARYGPIGERLNRAVWRDAKWVAFKLGRSRRHKFLSVVGPLMLPLLIAAYIVSLIFAFALIYYPRFPAHFVYSHDPSGSNLLDALYYSGITLTTVGYGDIVPRTTITRTLSIIEATTGVALISLSITYLITVYSALERKRAVALSLYHQAGRGADAAGLIAHHSYEGRFYGLRDTLRQVTRDIQQLLEAHVEHPVIHYFHPSEVYKSLPRILFLLLETCAVIRTSLDADEYAELRNYPEVRTLEAGARHVLVELVASLDLERRERPRKLTPGEREENETRWHARYDQNVERLRRAGIATRRDEEAARREYREQRMEWESALQRLSLHLGYDWEEVTGDSDLEYASDEAKQEPAPTR